MNNNTYESLEGGNSSTTILIVIVVILFIILAYTLFYKQDEAFSDDESVKSDLQISDSEELEGNNAGE
jgi:regulatory protein YycI of two-component signal transduction system YycFG